MDNSEARSLVAPVRVARQRHGVIRAPEKIHMICKVFAHERLAIFCVVIPAAHRDGLDAMRFTYFNHLKRFALCCVTHSQNSSAALCSGLAGSILINLCCCCCCCSFVYVAWGRLGTHCLYLALSLPHSRFKADMIMRLEECVLRLGYIVRGFVRSRRVFSISTYTHANCAQLYCRAKRFTTRCSFANCVNISLPHARWCND